MTRPGYRRARRSFWTLVILAVIFTGTLSRLLQAPPSPWIGLAVAVVGALTVITVGLAARVMLALTGRIPRDRDQPSADRTGDHT